MQISPIVDRAMASWLDEGSVTVLYYADRLYRIPFMFFTSGLLVVLLSHWSSRHYGKEAHSLRRDVLKASKAAWWLSLLITAILVSICRPLLRIALAEGEFSPEDLHELGTVFMCYMAGFPALVLTVVLARGHLVLKKTATLFRLAVLKVVVHISLNFLLMPRFGVKGLALSTSATMFVVAIGVALTLMRELSDANA
jgi:putative peptidoglycan lipid II flippase